MQPAMKMFVRRLEQMLNKVERSLPKDGDGDRATLLQCYCPGGEGFSASSSPTCGIQEDEEKWCSRCRELMDINKQKDSCPCFYYGPNAYEEARKRIKAWRKKNVT